MGMYRVKSDEYNEEYVLSNNKENAALAFANKKSLVGEMRIYVYDIFNTEWQPYDVTIEPVEQATTSLFPEFIIEDEAAKEEFPTRTPKTVRLKNKEKYSDSYQGKRIGVFSLSEFMIWQMQPVVKALMGKMVILYAQWNPEQTEITYMALCDDFDEVMVSDENPMDYSDIPGYGILVEANGVRITREK